VRANSGDGFVFVQLEDSGKKLEGKKENRYEIGVNVYIFSSLQVFFTQVQCTG
jgi:hypothetical protein